MWSSFETHIWTASYTLVHLCLWYIVLYNSSISITVRLPGKLAWVFRGKSCQFVHRCQAIDVGVQNHHILLFRIHRTVVTDVGTRLSIQAHSYFPPFELIVEALNWQLVPLDSWRTSFTAFLIDLEERLVVGLYDERPLQSIKVEPVT